jgi:uncharacterized protein YxjI
MALLRRHKDLGGTRYQMRERVFAIGDDFWIETDDGRRAYKVDGKALRIRSTFVIENPSGDELLKIQEKKLSIRDTMRIERDGMTVATVKKALVSPLRDRFTVDLETGGELKVKATSWTTSTRSNATATRSPRSRSAGSACETPTGSRSPRARTTR